MEDNCCIRVYADVIQIARCKKRLESMDEATSSLAGTFALAGNHVRLNILLLLQEEGKMCPCDLSDILKMNLSAISQHLRKLKDGNLVESKRSGQTVFYSVTDHFTRTVKPVLFPKTSGQEKVRLV